MVYTRLSQYKPAEELAPIKNTTRTMISSVSSPEEPHKDMSERPHWQAFKDSSESPHLGKREIINPRSLATQFGLMAGVLLRHKARNFGFRVLPDGFVRVSEIVISFFLTILILC
jgi:hypothetical protein